MRTDGFAILPMMALGSALTTFVGRIWAPGESTAQKGYQVSRFDHNRNRHSNGCRDVV